MKLNEEEKYEEGAEKEEERDGKERNNALDSDSLFFSFPCMNHQIGL